MPDRLGVFDGVDCWLKVLVTVELRVATCVCVRVTDGVTVGDSVIVKDALWLCELDCVCEHEMGAVTPAAQHAQEPEQEEFVRPGLEPNVPAGQSVGEPDPVGQ